MVHQEKTLSVSRFLPSAESQQDSFFYGQVFFKFQLACWQAALSIHIYTSYYIYVLRVPIFDMFFRKIFRVSLIFFPSFPEFFDNPLYTLPASTLRYAKFL